MIIQNQFYVGTRSFTRTYSNESRYVVRNGIAYSEACDPTELNRQYTEGDSIPLNELAVEEGNEQ